MWMNEGEIEQAMQKFDSHPVLGKGARFLGAFRDEVNAHSDGWAYWKLPAKAAERLMALLHGHLFAGMGAYPRLPEPTAADLTKAIAPIKAFYTRHGNKAGMKFPPLEIIAKTALQKGLREYTVSWHINVSAFSHEEAAKRALEIQRDPRSIATVFEVREEGHNESKPIDLSR